MAMGRRLFTLARRRLISSDVPSCAARVGRCGPIFVDVEDTTLP